MNRRDLLKFFGAGAAVVPIINGMPSGEVARIIEPPKVELAAPAKLMPGDASFMADLQKMRISEGVVYLTLPERTYRMSCNAFVTEYSMVPTLMQDIVPGGREFMPDYFYDLKFQVTGANSVQEVVK